jgi:uncharacterized protein YycO
VPALGDYGTVRTNGWAGLAIRIGTHSTVNHAFVYVGDGQIVEAEPDGARLASVDEYANTQWSNIELTDVQRSAIATQARLMLGVPYGWPDIAALSLACVGIHSPAINRRIEDEHRLICSQLVDRAYD